MQRIVVITKFRYLGDTIVATPFLHWLRDTCPSASITLFTGSMAASALEGCPFVDKVVVYDSDREPMGTAVARLRDGKYDVAYLLNRSFSSAVMAWRARIHKRIGFSTEFRRMLLTKPVHYSDNLREIDCYLDLLRVEGRIVDYALPQLWVTEPERQSMRNRLEEMGGLPRPIVLVQPGAKDPYKKQWGAEKFAEVIGALGIKPVLIGAKDEAEECSRVASLIGAVDLCGRTSLREALALLSLSDLLIANDTALVHAAVGVGTPTLTIHGPQTAQKWKYDTPPHRAIVAPSAHTRLDRHANRRALDELGPRSVIRAAREMIATVESASRP